VKGDEVVVKDSDALITIEPNVFLGVSIADCTPVLLYDPIAKVVAAVHAGWRGTQQEITTHTIQRMNALGSSSQNVYAFVGACASADRYEVGPEVAELFHSRYTRPRGDGKYLLDVRRVNVDQLLEAGVLESHIEVCDRCTISDDKLHSYRRDGTRSGRMLAVIGRKATNPR
jgi:polyphenol oxidase